MADMERGTVAAERGLRTAGHGSGRIANPHPLGILSFGATLFVLSLYSVHARGINTPNVIVGMGLFVGGLVQLLAGMWSFPRGSTFAATVYSMYGAFWISYAIILIPGSGIVAAFSTTEEFYNAIGIYFMIWMSITIIFLIASIKRHVTFLAFFFLLTLFFLLTGSGYLRTSDNLFKAGGAFGIATSAVTFYLGLAKLIESDHYFTMGRLPLGYLGSRDAAPGAY